MEGHLEHDEREINEILGNEGEAVERPVEGGDEDLNDDIINGSDFDV
jgi:hypothetical protein